MHYVKSFEINGVTSHQVACIELNSPPNAATKGAVGLLGMDMSSPTHDLYRCVAVKGSVYTWELVSAGLSVLSATVSRKGEESATFLYTELRIPNGYIPRVGDLIFDNESYMYQITALGSESCNVEFTGMNVGVPPTVIDGIKEHGDRLDTLEGYGEGSVKQAVANETLYTNTDPILTTLGGISPTTRKDGFQDVPIKDLITELLYPYTKPVIDSFTLSPSAGTKEKNAPITVSTASVKVTKKSKTIDSVSLAGGGFSTTNEDDITSGSKELTFSIGKTLDGTSDVSFSVKVKEAGADDNVFAVTSSATYTFVYPYFYGCVDVNTKITSSIILGLTKRVLSKANHTHGYTTDNNCPVIAYPKEYGQLKSIIDPNNFAQNWVRYEVSVLGENVYAITGNIKGAVPYYAYVGGKSSATAEYKFNY